MRRNIVHMKKEGGGRRPSFRSRVPLHDNDVGIEGSHTGTSVGACRGVFVAVAAGRARGRWNRAGHWDGLRTTTPTTGIGCGTVELYGVSIRIRAIRPGPANGVSGTRPHRIRVHHQSIVIHRDGRAATPGSNPAGGQRSASVATGNLQRHRSHDH
jgi:hypothetical protein